jgi:hypothetical protein
VGLLWSATRTWVYATTDAQGLPGVEVAISGGTALPLTSGVGLLLLAGIAGVVATSKIVRVVVGLILLVASAVALEASVSFGLERGRSAFDIATAAAGAVTDVTATGWWWMAAAGAVAGVLAGAATVAFGNSWPSLGSRYQRDTATVATPTTSAQMWDAMDRGEDPTSGPEVPQ